MSENVSLAILGAEPAFSEPLHVGRPNLGNRQDLLERFEDILNRRWLTNNGPYVQEFEKRLRDHCGVRECVVTCNATVALELLIRALDMTHEVIVPSFTFVATAHALQWQEIRPVFADVDPVTHTLDPERVEELITPRTGGIMGVHLWGLACDVDRLQEIADAHELPLIYDASHAFGCTHRGQPIGRFGKAEVFSFHATKIMNSLEGGAILTNDSDLAAKMRLMRNFGFDGKDSVGYLGINGKMNEFSGAMGLAGLDALNDFIDINRANYEQYRKQLGAIEGLTVLQHPGNETCNYHYVVVEVDESQTGLSRDALVSVLEAENILARRYFYPGCHKMEPYRSLQPMAHLVLPVTERLCETVMVMPTGQSVDEHGIARIAEVLRSAIQQSDSIRHQIGLTT